MSLQRNTEDGFSYLDVMIAVMILLVGVLALAAAVTAAVVRSREGSQQLLARHYATSTLESIFSARDLTDFGWDAIVNISGGSSQKGFVRNGNNPLPIKSDPGPDRVIGTADDTGSDIPGFQRLIVITDLCDPDRPSANCVPCGGGNAAPDCATPGSNPVMMRRIEVTVWYEANGVRRAENISTVMTNYLPPAN